MKTWYFFVVAILSLPVAQSQAYQESWTIDNFPEGANTRNLTATHSYNPAEKRIGSPFWVSAAAWSDAEVTNFPDPLFFYRMDDLVGSPIASDSSPNARDGTLLGNPVFGVTGQINTALQFDGVSDRITLPDEAALDTTTFSISMWVFLNATIADVQPRLADKVDSLGASGWRFQFLRDSNAFQLQTCNVTCGGISTPGNFPEGAIYHVVATYNAATNMGSVYVNGVLSASTTFANDPAANTETFRLGSSFNGDQEFKGWMDHVQFFNSALTSKQANFLYNAVRPTYPWLTHLDATGCTIDNDTQSYAGQYQFTRAWLLNATDKVCTWVGKIQYFDPGVPVNPAVDIYFTGSVLALNSTETDASGTNEILQSFNFIAPLLFFVLILIWAETTKEYLIYLLAIVVGGTATVSIWSEIESLRFVVIVIILLLVVRGMHFYFRANSNRE